jgi:Biotin-protein ligase, N terminal
MKFLPLIFLFISQLAIAFDALVWGGPGACKDGCLDSAIYVTKLAGFEPMIVTPENFDISLFEKAKIWIQPGGKSGAASNAMGPFMRQQLKNFIAQGGGYVGFCAGAFLTTTRVGETRVEGLGIVPGNTRVFRRAKGYPSVERMITPQGLQFHYWEGGPWFSLNKNELKNITVKSRYETNNKINGLETTFGLGRISVTGTHPEAPKWWYEDAHINDADGLDHELAANMIKWAAKK